MLPELAILTEGGIEPSREMEEFLDGIEVDIATFSQEVLMAVAEDIWQNSVGEVPVRTGFLRDSIEVEPLTDTNVLVRATAPYAVYVHEGTRFMDANPWFIRAFQATWDRMALLIQDVLDRLQLR